jgi:fatty acyl-CoA reductase
MSNNNSVVIGSEITEYYNNKSIFITGGTGFIGKVLIEKLLRSCYDLKTIYVLVRSKKGHNPKQRLNELLHCKVKKKIFFRKFFFFFFFQNIQKKIF